MDCYIFMMDTSCPKEQMITIFLQLPLYGYTESLCVMHLAEKPVGKGYRWNYFLDEDLKFFLRVLNRYTYSFNTLLAQLGPPLTGTKVPEGWYA